jgi:hypothetical protein
MFPSHNQSLTRESLKRPIHPGFLVTFNQILGGDSSNQANEQKLSTDITRGRVTIIIMLWNTIDSRSQMRFEIV